MVALRGESTIQEQNIFLKLVCLLLVLVINEQHYSGTTHLNMMLDFVTQTFQIHRNFGRIIWVVFRVADPHSFHPDPAFRLNTNPNPEPGL
jgi:hypothetical protein